MEDPSKSEAPAESAYRHKGPIIQGKRGPNSNEGDRWGNLKDAFRDALEHSKKEELPPHYRRIVEEYFKRMAEQKK